jgi:hypothetical protein
MGETDVDCIVTSLTAEEEMSANFALNNPSIQGDYIPEMTAEVLKRIEELSPENAADWYENLRFDALPDATTVTMPTEDDNFDVVSGGRVGDDEVPEAVGPSVSETGKVYALGPHRIFCGEPPADLAHFGIESARMALSWLGDLGDYQPAYAHLLSHTHGPVYLPTRFECLASDTSSFVEAGGEVGSILVGHITTASGHKGVHYKETGLPIIYGWEPDTPHMFYGERNTGTLWSLYSNPPKDDMPVSLAVQALRDGSRLGDSVLDIRAHKGASVVAAEKLGRKLFGYARTPKECDLIRARWTQFVHGERSDWRALTGESEVTPVDLTHGQPL